MVDTTQYQRDCVAWAILCLGIDSVVSLRERNYRFIEEAIELVQATGLSKEDVIRLVDHVYAKPEGLPTQEVGGVMVTLAVLCEANGIDLARAAATELARVEKNVELIRERHKTKLIRAENL